MPSKKENIKLDLFDIKKVFDKVGIPWVIVGGVVLGYARYKDIMDWDTDLDIVIYKELSDSEWKQLWQEFYKNNFNFPVTRVDFMYCNRRIECNIDTYHKKGDYYYSFPKSTPGIKFVEKAEYFDNVQLVEFLGDRFPIPGNIESFVADHYGADWETNIIKDHAQYFNDKRGSRNQKDWVTSRASKHGDLWPKALRIDDNI
jgi:phosphorylcholine metabolism protein LicD